MLNLYSNIVGNGCKAAFNNKKLLKNELPNPYRGYSSVLYFDFTNNFNDVCENVFNIKVNCEISKCYMYLADASNILKWNSYIYQVFK